MQVYTGNVPFSARRFYGGVVLDVMRGIRPPRPSLESCPDLKDELWDVIQSCWAQDPCQRRELSYIAVYNMCDSFFLLCSNNGHGGLVAAINKSC